MFPEVLGLRNCNGSFIIFYERLIHIPRVFLTKEEFQMIAITYLGFLRS
jgi:hypothetical protein